ncbi:MAG: sulfite exporter TauE/SafE family protein [Gammaproteobacteria bacterium]|nr:sulfite exporter TauE/SafE family protein [Gammaproteobacteria bacterium]MCW5582846.1 sulfite exporter TauE/SafE family protein [Gammaproteobacteria bacterium]
MTILIFSGLLLAFSFFAGLLGALTGLGGGVVIIPVLVLFFHINIHYAMGASLISVIATSSGATIAYLREGYTNLRIGMFLETTAVMGAFIGALLIAVVSKTFLAVLFSFLLFFSAYLTLKRKEDHEEYQQSHPWAIALKLDSSYPVKNKLLNYHVQNVPRGLFIMSIAGLIAGLLGVGSGTLKVLAMDQALRLPYKVATTTSNFMIGITAAVSTGIYFSHGYINPVIVFPVMIGVILGAFLGARILPIIHTRTLRMIFSIVISFIGFQMLYKGLTGTI